jgi:thymidylate synthase (FAD)
MKVELKHYTDIDLKYKEHFSYTFYIDGSSRALIQELMRHQQDPSVESTRYVLNKHLKEEEPFISWYDSIMLGVTFRRLKYIKKKTEKYLVFTGNDKVDFRSILALEELRKSVKEGIKNDLAKYSLPESFKVSLHMTIDIDKLQNLLQLRSNPNTALWEIVELAKRLYEALPEEHIPLFKEYIYKKD